MVTEDFSRSPERISGKFTQSGDLAGETLNLEVQMDLSHQEGSLTGDLTYYGNGELIYNGKLRLNLENTQGLAAYAGQASFLLEIPTNQMDWIGLQELDPDVVMPTQAVIQDEIRVELVYEDGRLKSQNENIQLFVTQEGHLQVTYRLDSILLVVAELSLEGNQAPDEFNAKIINHNTRYGQGRLTMTK
jgi:hypothetical protein